MAGESLTKKTKWFYGIGDIGNAIVNSAVQFFLLKFYTDGALILPALAGSALLIGKIWDAINDPLIGWFSDRATSPLGKRRVFMIFGAIPLGMSIALLWFVPPGLSSLMAFIWIAFTFILFDTLWTLTNVPYYALTSELTEDYDERSTLTTYRMVLAVPAYLVGAALTPAIVGMFAIQSSGYAAIGIIYGVLASASLLIAAFGIRERRAAAETRNTSQPIQSLLATFQNSAFVRLCAAYIVVNLAFALIKTLMVYFLQYQLNMAAETPLVMGLMLISVTVSLFVWKNISLKIDKGPAYAAGMTIGAVAVALTFFLPAHPTILIYGVAVLAGIGFGAQWVFPWAMIADVADVDRAKTGQHRSGMYYGVWGLATKASEALAIASSGWILTGFGYVPNVAQSELARLGIRLFFGPIPAVIILAALPLLIWYPITRKAHSLIREQIANQDTDMASEQQVAIL
jgi:glycoside/pentoside/hexuronide:cation symporter, GPH family